MIETVQDLCLNRQREEIEAAEEIAALRVSLYVPRGEDPRVSLRKIRAFLYGAIEPEQPIIALAVVNLDRVIEMLAGCELRWGQR